jgi:nucleoside-diphosphate-sugar epimerase
VVQGNVLLTGYPGFIGRRLADRLVEGGAQVTALVEPRMTGAAREASGGRVEVVEGDIAQRRLGLADAHWERLTAQVRHVFHLAAVYDLGVPLELAQRVNVDGTGNVLELCRACERLERLNYVSTAYVAGVRRGIVYEHELTLGQDFKNHYESTKFQAEVWVRQELDRVPTTIYRPAIVVGDSRTGDTQKFDGPYFLLRVISYAERHGLPIPQFGRSNAPFNVVPVDFVLDAMLAGAREPAAVGQTFHLVDPEPVTAAELLRILAEAYAGRAPSYRLPARLIEAALLASSVREAFGGAPRESIRYLNHPVRFDARRAADVLGGAAGLRVPRFAEYAAALVRFFREHEDDPAYSVRGLGGPKSG